MPIKKYNLRPEADPILDVIGAIDTAPFAEDIDDTLYSDAEQEGFMELLLDVIRVVPQEDRTLLLTFENNEQRIFDMVPYLEKKPFLKLKSLPLFMKAKAENGTVVLAGQY